VEGLEALKPPPTGDPTADRFAWQDRAEEIERQEAWGKRNLASSYYTVSSHRMASHERDSHYREGYYNRSHERDRQITALGDRLHRSLSPEYRFASSSPAREGATERAPSPYQTPYQSHEESYLGGYRELSARMIGVGEPTPASRGYVPVGAGGSSGGYRTEAGASAAIGLARARAAIAAGRLGSEVGPAESTLRHHHRHAVPTPRMQQPPAPTAAAAAPGLALYGPGGCARYGSPPLRGRLRSPYEPRPISSATAAGPTPPYESSPGQAFYPSPTLYHPHPTSHPTPSPYAMGGASPSTYAEYRGRYPTDEGPTRAYPATRASPGLYSTGLHRSNLQAQTGEHGWRSYLPR